MRPEDFSIALPGHRRRPVRRAAAPAARRRSTTGRAVIAAAAARCASSCSSWPPTELEAARGDLELARRARRASRHARSRASRSQRWPTTAHGRRAAARPRLGHAAAAARPRRRRPASAGSASRRSPRRPSSATRPACGVDRDDRRRAGARGRGRARLRPRPQPARRDGPGRGRRRARHRHGDARGHASTRDGRQRNPHLLDYKLQTTADAPAIEPISSSRAPASDGGPRGSKGVGEPPVVPDRRRGRERDRRGDRRARPRAADDPGARLGRRVATGAVVSHTFGRARDGRRGARAARRDAGRAARSRAAPTSSSAPARARRRCPTSLVAIDRIGELDGIATSTDGGLRIGALTTHAGARVRDARSPGLAGAGRRVGDGRLARHPRTPARSAAT